MDDLLSTRTPKSFSAEEFYSHSASSVYWCLWLFLPRGKTAFPDVELHDASLSPIFQAHKVLLDGSTTIWCSSHSSQFCVICKLAAMHFVLSSRSLMMMLNSNGSSMNPWDTPLAICLQLQFVLKSQPSGSSSSASLQCTSLCTYLISTSSVCL